MFSTPSSTDRNPDRNPADHPAPVEHTVRVAASLDWRPWLIARLIDGGFARRGETKPDKVRFYLTKLEHAIAAALPDAPVSLDTLGNVIYRGMLPSHPTARGLAAALHVSEIAILLRSGQLDYEAVTPLLLSDAPAILRTEHEWQAARQHVMQTERDPHFRARLVAMIDREWQDSQQLAAKLRWLGLAADEWEDMRRELNTPSGRERLTRALFGGETARDNDEMRLEIPAEFVAAAGDASMDT